MITGGIDLASQDRGTASCRIAWSRGGASVVDLEVGRSDAALIELMGSVDKVGIDVPLGWPVGFVEAVSLHSGSDGAWPEAYDHADTRALRYRRTDLVVRERTGGTPLSVSTDRIALPAMRAAALLARLEAPVPLDGSGLIVEAYPAAALRRWGFAWRRYKREENRSARRDLLEAFRSRTASWLDVRAEFLRRCLASDDAFDAVVCALVARAQALGRCEPVEPRDLPLARREGWIALPLPGSLEHLSD